MVESQEVINLLKKKLDKKNYVSMFITGSMPKELIPEGDLDISIIIRNKQREEFFRNIQEILEKIKKKDSSVTYSFFRGPIKYKYKGLIHVLVYTDVKTKENLSLGDEIPQLVSSIKKCHKMVSGKDINKILKTLPKRNEDKKRVQEKYNLLIKHNLIAHKQWVKTPSGWKGRKVWKRPSKFLQAYLKERYKKYL